MVLSVQLQHQMATFMDYKIDFMDVIQTTYDDFAYSLNNWNENESYPRNWFP